MLYVSPAFANTAGNTGGPLNRYGDGCIDLAAHIFASIICMSIVC